VRVTTVRPGWRTTQAVRTTRRTLFTVRTATRGAATLLWWTSAGRCGGFSATWTAPPPRIAPPAVQAHNFARAILTDIATYPVQGRDTVRPSSCEQRLAASGCSRRMQKKGSGASALTTKKPFGGPQMAVPGASVPIEDKGGRAVNGTEPAAGG
jgi:hypothetical protein